MRIRPGGMDSAIVLRLLNGRHDKRHIAYSSFVSFVSTPVNINLPPTLFTTPSHQAFGEPSSLSNFLNLRFQSRYPLPLYRHLTAILDVALPEHLSLLLVALGRHDGFVVLINKSANISNHRCDSMNQPRSYSRRPSMNREVKTVLSHTFW